MFTYYSCEKDMTRILMRADVTCADHSNVCYNVPDNMGELEVVAKAYFCDVDRFLLKCLCTLRCNDKIPEMPMPPHVKVCYECGYMCTNMVSMPFIFISLCCNQPSYVTNGRITNIPLQQQMAAKAHESNCQKWPKMAICESPNGQNDPRNINRKYTDQE